MKKFAYLIIAISAISLYTCLSLMANSYPNTYVAETQTEEEYYTDEELLELGIWREDNTVYLEGERK